MEEMKKTLKAADFKKHVIKLIDCFSDLMKHVDVNFFAHSPHLWIQTPSISSQQTGAEMDKPMRTITPASTN